VDERRQHRAVARVRPAVNRASVLVALAQDQPVALLPVEVGRDERPDALQALPGQVDGQPAVALLLEELVGAVIPDLDRPGPVLARGDLARKRRVVERMVLDVDRKGPGAWLEWNALGHGPGGEDAVALEPEVVVEAAGGVLLNDEDRRLALRAAA